MISPLTSRCLSCVPTSQLDSGFHSRSGSAFVCTSVCPYALLNKTPCGGVQRTPWKRYHLHAFVLKCLNFRNLPCKRCTVFYTLWIINKKNNNQREKSFLNVLTLRKHGRNAKICLSVTNSVCVCVLSCIYFIKQISACSAVQYAESLCAYVCVSC